MYRVVSYNQTMMITHLILLLQYMYTGLTALGLKGGCVSLFDRRSQSIRLKKACSLMSLSPSRPQPRRLEGCLVISCSRYKTTGRQNKGTMLLMWIPAGVHMYLGEDVHNNVGGNGASGFFPGIQFSLYYTTQNII